MIRVEIDNGKLSREKHEITIGEMIVKSLKLAGIPVVGFFAITSVERGKLVYESPMDNSHRFTWREDPDDKSSDGFVRTQLPNGATVYKNGRHLQHATTVEDDEL